MGFFSKKTNWSVLEIGWIKVCVACMGIALGIWLYPWVHDYALYFFLLYLAIGIFYLLPLWLRKLKEKQ